MFSILVVNVVAILLLPSLAKSTEGSFCKDLQGRQFGLCNAFCNAQKCWKKYPDLMGQSCEVLYRKFRRASGGTDPPCWYLVPRFRYDTWTAPGTQESFVTTATGNGGGDLDFNIGLTTTSRGLVSLAAVEDLIDTVDCSSDPSASIIVKLRSGVVFPTDVDLSLVFPNESTLVVLGDIFGSCSLEDTSSFFDEEDVDGLLIVQYQTLIHESSDAQQSVKLSGQVATFTDQFDEITIQSVHKSRRLVESHRQLATFPISQQTITIPVGDEGSIKLEIESGQVTATAQTAFFEWSILASFYSLSVLADYSADLVVSDIDVDIELSTDPAGINIPIVDVPLRIYVPLGIAYSNYRLGFFIQVNGTATIELSGKVKLCDGGLTYSLPLNSVAVSANGDLGTGIQLPNLITSSNPSTIDPTPFGTGEASNEITFSIEGFFGLDYGLRFFISSLSDDPIAALEQKAGAFLTGTYKAPPFPVVTPIDPPYDFGVCNVTHFIEVRGALGYTNLTAKVDFEWDPGYFFDFSIALNASRTIIQESKADIVVVCVLSDEESEEPSIAPSAFPTPVPTPNPTPEPTPEPTPTDMPSGIPTAFPSDLPSSSPSTAASTGMPSGPGSAPSPSPGPVIVI